MTAATVAPPRGMRTALVSVLDRSRELDSPGLRRARAATLRQVSTAMRDQGLAAVGVRELDQLADALDYRARPQTSSSSPLPDDETPPAPDPSPPAGRAPAVPDRAALLDEAERLLEANWIPAAVARRTGLEVAEVRDLVDAARAGR